jgi:hypothetical protein
VGHPLWREDGSVFVYAVGPCQRSLSRVRVPWDSRPYFTVSDLRFPFSLPPTTRRVKVEVFDPASTRGKLYVTILSCTRMMARANRKPSFQQYFNACEFISAWKCLPSRCLEIFATRTTGNTAPLLLRALPSNGGSLQNRLLATGLYTQY